MFNKSLMPGSIRLLAIVFISILAVTFGNGTSQTASAQAQNEIKGVVVNGTDGAEVPEDLTVILMSIDNAANQIIEQEQTTVGPDGTFSFSNLISGPGVSFRIVADAGDFTPSIDLSGVDDWSNVRLTIWEQTTSLDDITISSYVMMIPTIDGPTRQAGVLAVVNVNNSGDMVWVPNVDDPGLTGLDLLRFNLPDGFSDLAVESELPQGNILQIPTGFAMTNPIPPGEAAILMSYILAYEGDGFDFNLKLPYGAGEVRMLLPDEAGTISGTGFGSLESIVIAEGVYNSAEGNDYLPGEEVAITFSGLPQPSFSQQIVDFFDGRTYIFIIVGLVGVALLGILGFAMYSSRKNAEPGSEREYDDSELTTRDDVLSEIAALDEEYEAGKIGEGAYNERRDELIQLASTFDDDSAPDESPDSDGSEPDLVDSESRKIGEAEESGS